MSDAEQRLAKDRENRGAARGLFDTRLAQVKSDLSARGIGGRIKAQAQEKVFGALDQGIDLARESKGIIAATAGLIALWLLRAPLIGKVKELLGPADVQEEADNDPFDTDQEHLS